MIECVHMLVCCGLANEQDEPTNESKNKQTNRGLLTYFSIVQRALQFLFRKIAVFTLTIFCCRWKRYVLAITNIFKMSCTSKLHSSLCHIAFSNRASLFSYDFKALFHMIQPQQPAESSGACIRF